MPNVWTHILFCEDMLEVIDTPPQHAQQEPFLNIGAQGPDPFFYYNFWPWKQGKLAHEIGSALHTYRCGDFLMDLIRGAKDADVSTKAYVFGFVTHHVLDRNAHPFIHYHAGYEKNKHQKLEIIIDTVILERFRKLKTWKAPVYKEIDAGSFLHQGITDLLHHVIKKHYPFQLDNTYIQKAYRDMKLALKVLYDPYGWKNTFFAPVISSFSHQSIKDDVDYLNESHHTWYHPATNEPSNKSFLDIYECARAEGQVIMSELLYYWHKPSTQSEEKLRKLIQNISYDTGKPVELELKLQYCEPIV
ncbi:zinc dependent phospholipase C family protein [Aquibacillus sp. 3ASR75-11]|uniref:Zinc dependent phospholipase C family protein n=1 Tax=Terrihalobacillus insolitus TaxID=2950438 RepID=A0A9X4ANM5_9BACI|nr:zinc dependent phospholipase C family protein [Terrihalobacillus insolitus]MDC3413553.1 zinc dependent phospholipase C family protein [Terrihalobacillus insolitus]MDC3424690.1 zinc dependent phospholipase C family protein [Terrihalobacillus insolitus]